MKILKQGFLPENKVYRGRCSTCGCEVECIGKEVAWRQARYNDQDAVIACPTDGCDKDILVFEYKGK